MPKISFKLSLAALSNKKHRIIICLEQSTVEWANSVSRPLIRLVDPSFERTVLVSTKFDNRVKELRSKDAALKYLCSSETHSSKQPFFIWPHPISNLPRLPHLFGAL